MQYKKKKVIFIMPSLRGGGAERVIVTLLKHLDRNKFRLTLAVVDTREMVYRDELPSDVEFIDLGVTRVRYALLRIITLIWKRRPDVVFSTLGHLNLSLSMIRPFLPRRGYYIAREAIIVSEQLKLSSYPSFWGMLYRRFYKRHDRLVCQTHCMQSDLVEGFGFPVERSVVIHNPVDIGKIDRDITKSHEQLGFPVGCIRLVAAGRMTETKGFHLLVDAIALLDNPKIHLCILGEGALLDEFKQRAVAKGVSGQVDFVGFQANPYIWFAQADAFVLSSHFEGLPNVVLEALACGTPVIATPALGGIQKILNDICDCVIADEISAASLANAIGKWLSGPRNRIHRTVVAPYRLEHIVAQYESLLQVAAPKSEI